MLDSTSGPVASPPRSFNRPFDSAQLKRAYADDGYLVLRGVVSTSELETVSERLSAEYQEWRNSKESFRGGGMLSGHLNCYPGTVARRVVEELREQGIFELAQALLPTDPAAFRIGCNFNLPGSVEQHYHVDGAFLESFLIVNVALVDTELKNGAIDIVPHTHKRFYKYWEFAAGRVSRGTTRVCMARGDVLIRPSTLWHRGMPNQTDVARPMLAITLGEKGVKNDDPFAYAGGRVEFQTNWFRPSALGRLRERTTVAVPFTYSAYRFARSLFGNKGYASF